MTPGKHRAPRRRWLPVNWPFEAFVVGVISCALAITCLTVMGAGII